MSSHWRRLLVVDLVATLLAVFVVGDIVVLEIDRQIDLTKSVAEVSNTIRFRVEGDTPITQLLLCEKRKTIKKEAWFKAVLGDQSTGKELSIAEIDRKHYGSIPENIICKGLQLPDGKRSPNEEMRIVTVAVYSEVMQPLPEQIRQGEAQRMTYKDNLYVFMPYTVKSQTTKVKLPKGEILAKTITDPFKQEKGMLRYGPYVDIAPFQLQPLAVHFGHDGRFALATKVVKEIQVSLWGNVYVEESYEIENAGAKLKGTWSRLDYSLSRSAQKHVISDLVAEMPLEAHSIYYVDEIGNVSTSQVVVASKSLMAVLRPRYPLFGGWKTKFRFGYSWPLEVQLACRQDGGHALSFSFAPSITKLVIRDYELRIVLPEGSFNIDHNLKQLVETSHDIKHWYFDFFARPVAVLRRKNVVFPYLSTKGMLHYQPTVLAFYSKLLLFMSTIFGFFVVCMVYIRLDFSIVGIKEQNKEKIHYVLSQLKKLFKEQQECLEELRSCISQMKSSHSINKASTTRNKLESKLKETETKICEGVTALKAASYNRLFDANELKAKANDYQSHCFQLYDKVSSLFLSKASKKEIDHEVQIMEKTVSHLADGMQEALGYMFLESDGR